MKVALKCVNRLYVKPNILKDAFTWIYVFPDDYHLTHFEHYLAKSKYPQSFKDCMHIRTNQLTHNEIEKWRSILTYTKNVGAYYDEYSTGSNNLVQRQYICRYNDIELK